MNREHWKKMLPIVTAFAEGKDVRHYSQDEGWTSEKELCFCGDPEDYRIAKPEVLTEEQIRDIKKLFPDHKLFAFDSDGKARIFKVKPVQGIVFWDARCDNVLLPTITKPEDLDWKGSLIEL